MEDTVANVPRAYRHDEKFVREWSKMLRGEVYEATYAPFIELLRHTRSLLHRYNTADPLDAPALDAMLRSLLGRCGSVVTVNPPFRCDYGCNVRVGENFFANFNLTILDEALVTIGDNVFIGPNVSIYTACHPLDPESRATGVEWAEPVTIGSDVWIGGGATILPGVTIGDGCTIGAGAVVTRDVPPHTLAAGNPARVLRRLRD